MIIKELLNKIHSEHKCDSVTCFCSFLITFENSKNICYPVSFIPLFKQSMVRHFYCLLNNKSYFDSGEKDFSGNEGNYVIPENFILINDGDIYDIPGS